MSIYCNKDLAHTIAPCDKHQELNIITNGGSKVFQYMAAANLLLVLVHINLSSLANILSLSDVANIPGVWLTIDMEVEHAILLHVDNNIIKFHECHDGLYYYDINPNKCSNTSFFKLFKSIYYLPSMRR